MSERQTSIPFARSRASKKHSGKLLSPAQMRERSLAQNKATALEQAQMRERKVTLSNYFMYHLSRVELELSRKLKQFKARGQFKGGVAV